MKMVLVVPVLEGTFPTSLAYALKQLMFSYNLTSLGKISTITKGKKDITHLKWIYSMVYIKYYKSKYVQIVMSGCICLDVKRFSIETFSRKTICFLVFGCIF